MVGVKSTIVRGRFVQIWVVSSFVLLIIALAQAAPVDDFNRANQLYEQEEYDEAIRVYASIIEKDDVRNPDLYYNLGNAYFRSGRLGPAIVWLERAARLRPWDEDIHYNLRLLRSQIENVPIPEPGLLSNLMTILAGLLTVDGYLTLASVLFVALIAWLIICVWSKRWRGWRAAALTIIAVLAIGCLALSIGKYNYEYVLKSAIVVVPTVTATKEPRNDADVAFEAPEGTKVSIEKRLRRGKQAWWEVSLPNGVLGYVQPEWMMEI